MLALSCSFWANKKAISLWSQNNPMFSYYMLGLLGKLLLAPIRDPQTTEISKCRWCTWGTAHVFITAAPVSSRALSGVPYSTVYPNWPVSISTTVCDASPSQHSKLLGLSLPLGNPQCAGLHSSTYWDRLFSARGHYIHEIKSIDYIRTVNYFHRMPFSLRHHPLTEVCDKIKCKQVNKIKIN